MQFDATTIDTEDNFDIPEGWYDTMITFVSEGENKNMTGRLIELHLTIVNGPLQGRNVRTWISYVHTNATAQEMGQKALAKICQALGIPQLTDEHMLLNKKICTKIRPPKAGSDFNEVKDYRACDKMDFSDLESDIGAGSAENVVTPAPNPWQK